MNPFCFSSLIAWLADCHTQATNSIGFGIADFAKLMQQKQAPQQHM